MWSRICITVDTPRCSRIIDNDDQDNYEDKSKRKGKLERQKNQVWASLLLSLNVTKCTQSTMSVRVGPPEGKELTWGQFGRDLRSELGQANDLGRWWCLSPTLLWSFPSSSCQRGLRRSWGWRWSPRCLRRGRSRRRAPPSHSPAPPPRPGSFASGTAPLVASSVLYKKLR